MWFQRHLSIPFSKRFREKSSQINLELCTSSVVMWQSMENFGWVGFDEMCSPLVRASHPLFSGALSHQTQSPRPLNPSSRSSKTTDLVGVTLLQVGVFPLRATNVSRLKNVLVFVYYPLSCNARAVALWGNVIATLMIIFFSFYNEKRRCLCYYMYMTWGPEGFLSEYFFSIYMADYDSLVYDSILGMKMKIEYSKTHVISNLNYVWEFFAIFFDYLTLEIVKLFWDVTDTHFNKIWNIVF